MFGALTELKSSAVYCCFFPPSCPSAANYLPYRTRVALGIFRQCGVEASKVRFTTGLQNQFCMELPKFIAVC